MILLTLSVHLAGCTPTDSATWRYDTAETEDDTTGEWEDDEEFVYEKLIWGVLEGEEGWTGFYYADPDAGND